MRRSGGFSLIEIAVVLTIVGASAFLFMALITAGAGGGDGQGADGTGSASRGTGGGIEQLGNAQSQLLGFLRSQNRLPCPDTDGDGHENCGSTGDPNMRGVLPYRTMGLAQPALNASQLPLSYAVYRRPQTNPRQDMDLARLINRFDPLLPAGERTGVSNALDFCHALRGSAAMPLSNQHLRVDSQAPLNQAYVLVDPGSIDADDQGHVLDGANAVGVGFESPGRPRGEDYDDTVLAMGFAQLAARLDCPTTMARVNAAARAAVVAADIAELTGFFRDFRSYSHDVAVDDLVLASVGLATTVAGGAFTLVDAAVSIAQGINSGGAAAVAAAIPIGVSIALLAYAVADAATGVASAEETRVLSEALRDAAIAENQAAQLRLATKLAEAKQEEMEARLR